LSAALHGGLKVVVMLKVEWSLSNEVIPSVAQQVTKPTSKLTII
jgi:hypothetical protein